MKIAITGGADALGARIAAAYLDAGHDVCMLDTLARGSMSRDTSDPLLDPRARFYPVDIRDAAVQTILQQERPDVVNHLATQPIHNTQPFYTEQALSDADMHIRGLLNVLDGCVAASVKKLIFASNGITMYRPMHLNEHPQQELPIVTEDMPLCPQRPADISKVAGEWYVRYYTSAYALEHTILRYAEIYGALDGDALQDPTLYFAASLVENQRPVIRGSGQDIRDFLHVDDVVQANLCALERGRNSTLHISSGQGYTLNQFYCAVAQELSSALLPVYLSGSLNEPTAVVLDNSLAQQHLGWRPRVSFSEGVRRTVEHLSRNMVHSHTEDSPARKRVEAAVAV